MVQVKSAYITIPVSNLRRSAEWYGEHLGFNIVTEDPLFLELVNESGVTQWSAPIRIWFHRV